MEAYRHFSIGKHFEVLLLKCSVSEGPGTQMREVCNSSLRVRMKIMCIIWSDMHQESIPEYPKDGLDLGGM